ncbi:hypothetical protein AB1N83_013810 [Pleurotus pulmonarius]
MTAVQHSPLGICRNVGEIGRYVDQIAGRSLSLCIRRLLSSDNSEGAASSAAIVISAANTPTISDAWCR